MAHLDNAKIGAPNQMIGTSMHQLNEAMRKRVAAAMEKSGWEMDPETPAISAVRCWFYSVNIHRGPRVAAMVSQDLYRSVVSGDGIIAELLRQDPNHKPFEQYLGTVAEFDSLPEASQRDLGKRNTVIACLASFARTTQTWGLAPPLNEVPGLHFVAIDWQAKNGAHVLRSGLAIGDAPLTKEDLAEIASIQLGLHLARCPQESPIDF